MQACRRAAASSMRILGMPVSIAFAMPPRASISSIMVPGRVHQLVGEPLDIVRAGPRIHHPGDAGFLLQVDLRVAGDARGEIGGQREGLIERVGVQRLGVARRPRPAPPRRCARRCCRDPAPRGSSPRSGSARARASDLGFLGSKPLTILAHSTRAARILAISMKWFMPMPQKKEMRGAKSSTRKARP